ncbi:MAG: hypothetical protein COV44_07040 [Deltaproteobacteria bacterium CG11_big_fil_rev_8_21_14_0_20_45_16]|nr:MAG: hypothetical protein COV44_07040 [Deltaproteobacteria bacterium CG11_big_fil_rev_8_21_14_0_20_45_16]
MKHETGRSSKIVESDLELATILSLWAKNWKLLAGSALVFGVIAGAVSFFFIDRVYKSQATIFVASPTSSSRGGLAGLASSSGLEGLLSLGTDTNKDRMIAVLQSDHILFSVIHDLDLMAVYRPEDLKGSDKTRAIGRELLKVKIRDNTDIDSEGSAIRLSFRGPTPELSSKVVSTYLDNLRTFLSESLVTKSKRTEDFIHDRLSEAETGFEGAKNNYISLQKSKGVVRLSSQAGLALKTASELQARMIEKDIELELYRDILKDSSEVDRLESEKREIQKQITRLIEGNQLDLPIRGSGKRVKARVDLLTPLQKIPNLEAEFASAQAELSGQKLLVDSLRLQYEAARIETKRGEPSFEIIDSPRPVIVPDGPSHKLNATMGMIIGFILAVAYVFIGSGVYIGSKRKFPILKVNLLDAEIPPMPAPKDFGSDQPTYHA